MPSPASAPGRFPSIAETRPRRPRRCLRCDRVMLSTVAERLCPGCARVTEELEVGAIAAAGIVVSGRRSRAPAGP